MTDLTCGINMHQPIEGIVADYNKANPEPEQIEPPEPYAAMEPNREAEQYVRKGRLNPTTGREIPLTSKSRAVISAQCGVVTESYKKGYDRVQWLAYPRELSN